MRRAVDTRHFYSDRLRELRMAADLTQIELAQLTGLSNAGVSLWETGAQKPNLYTVKILAEVFDVPIDYFYQAEWPEVPDEMLKRGKQMKDELKKRKPLVEIKDDRIISIARVLGITPEEVENIEKHFSGMERAIKYSQLIKTQIENLRQFQNVLDSFIGKVNERFLELEDLRKKAIKLSDAVKHDADELEFDLVREKIGGKG